MKKHFTTGLIILLPAALTFFIVGLIVKIITSPFQGIVQSFFAYYGILDKQFLFIKLSAWVPFISKIVILIGLFAIILAIGVIGLRFFNHIFINIADSVFHRIPVINTIYRSCKEVVHTLLIPSSNNFSQVVLVPFPSPKSLVIGLITRDTIPIETDKIDHEIEIAVFVPGTPNPLMGFVLMYKPSQVVYLDMSVEDALKYVVSCGAMVSKFNQIPAPPRLTITSP